MRECGNAAADFFLCGERGCVELVGFRLRWELRRDKGAVPGRAGGLRRRNDD
jgi:hypothetical protein